MKNTRSLRKLAVVVGATVLSVGFLFAPTEASAGGPPKHKGNPWHDNGNHYGWYNRGYRQNPAWNHYPPGYNRPRSYEYYRGNRGYWDTQNGVRIFINL